MPIKKFFVGHEALREGSTFPEVMGPCSILEKLVSAGGVSDMDSPLSVNWIASHGEATARESDDVAGIGVMTLLTMGALGFLDLP